MKLNFKRMPLPTGELYSGPAPLVGTKDSAAADFFAAYRMFLRPSSSGLQAIPHNLVRVGDLVKYHTGIALEIPQGWVGIAAPRSSVVKYPLELANNVGIIDSDFRGELTYIYRVLDATNIEYAAYQVGDRCGQLMVTPYLPLELTEASELSATARGTGGYGSTGK